MNAFRKSVRGRLIIAFSIILAVPSLAVGFLSYGSAKDTTDQQLMSSAQENVNLLNTIIDDSIRPQTEDIEKLSKVVSAKLFKEKNGAKLQEIFDQYKQYHSNLDTIYIGTTTGGVMQSPVVEVINSEYDPRERPWYQDAMKQKGQTIITEPYWDEDAEKMMLTICRQTDDGSGVIGFDILIDNINAMVSKVSVGKKGFVTLLDENGQFISHPTAEPGSKAKESFYKNLYNKDSGRFDVTKNGEKRTMVFSTNKLTGWKIAGTMYGTEVNDAAKPILNYVVFTIVIALILGAIAVYFIVRSITKPLAALNHSALQISQGNLTEEITVESEDEIGELSHSFGKMSESLRRLINEVDSSADQIAASAEELTASSEQTAAAVQQVSTGVQQVAESAETQESGLGRNGNALKEVSGSIGKVAELALTVAKMAQHASLEAEEGGSMSQSSIQQMNTIHDSVDESHESLRSLTDRSNEIESIIDVIVSISEQTNLLALNAAIEAARAGETGKGFAVVADEVRKLAEQSQTSAKQISSLISGIQQDTVHSFESMQKAKTDVANGLDISNKTNEKFVSIVHNIKDIAPQVANVATISEQISSSIKQVVSTADELSEISQENAAVSEEISTSTGEQLAAMEEITTASQSLANLAEQLQTMIREFKV